MAQFKTLLAVSIAAAALAVAAQAQTNVHDPKPSAAVTAAVADAGRPDADKARDGNRKPAEVLAVAGVKPGDSVVELGSGGGYYTRILAKAVGPKGKVFAIVGAAPPGAATRLQPIQAANPNLQIVTDDMTKMANVPEKVDMVWTTDNYHDFHNRTDMAAFNKAMFNVLKPGGIFLVEDHAAAKGAGATVTGTLHRIEPTVVQQEVTAAGFKLVRTSDILANPADNHATQNAEADIRGKTDRFIMVFQKP
ncbi:MAG TPA: methyltransferase domain-containing protein [Caulobacteraceae bacterium]